MNKHVICFTPGEVFDWIEHADLRQLQEVMDAVQERYAFLAPDWDILYLALPRNDTAQRKHLLEQACEKNQSYIHRLINFLWRRFAKVQINGTANVSIEALSPDHHVIARSEATWQSPGTIHRP